MSAYYNENDPYAAQWLRNLIAVNHIAPGDVDARSIKEVKPQDIKGYTQCHFFAGIAGWSLALRLAGWPDDKAVWTGSCPCQPFSAAGQRKGVEDPRHLWPEFHRLIVGCRPAIVLGEQVASKDGRGWLATVRADLETLGYACGCADLCAAGVGAPHIRQRLYWVADALSAGRPQRRASPRNRSVARSGMVSRVEHANLTSEHEQSPGGQQSIREQRNESGSPVVNTAREQARLPRRAREPGSAIGIVGDAKSTGPQGPRCKQGKALGNERGRLIGLSMHAWADCDWLPCRDGKARPVESGTFPLAHGIPNRMGRLRAYGNAIVPQVAAEFIKAYLDCAP